MREVKLYFSGGWHWQFLIDGKVEGTSQAYSKRQQAVDEAIEKAHLERATLIVEKHQIAA